MEGMVGGERYVLLTEGPVEKKVEKKMLKKISDIFSLYSGHP